MKHGPVKKQPWSEHRMEKATKALHKRRCEFIAHQQAIANQIQEQMFAVQALDLSGLMQMIQPDEPPAPVIH